MSQVPDYIIEYKRKQDEADVLLKQAKVTEESAADTGVELMEIWGEIRAIRNSISLYDRLLYECWLEQQWGHKPRSRLIFEGKVVGTEVALMVASRIG